MNRQKFDSRLLTGFCAVILLPSLAWVLHTFWFVEHAARSQGTVTAMTRGANGFYGPSFTFTNAQGTVYTHDSIRRTGDFAFEIGETMTVLYDATDPETARIDVFWEIWGGPLIVFGIALVFSIFAGLYQRHLNRSDQSQAEWIGGAVIGMMLMMLAVGLCYFFRQYWFVNHATRTEGHVVAVESGRSLGPNSGRSAYLVFNYTNASGNNFTQREAFGSFPPDVKPGGTVPVLYDAAAPGHALVDSFASLWTGPIFITGFPVLFGGVFGLVWWLRSRWSQYDADAG